MKQHIKYILLIVLCIVTPIFAMQSEPDIQFKPMVNIIPEYYAAITYQLQQMRIYNDITKPILHNHRIFTLQSWEDCRIIEILCENTNDLFKNAKMQYPLAITAFKHKKRHSIQCGIKCYFNNQNYLTRRSCFAILDKLKDGWVEICAHDYYTHPYKITPDDPHKDTINDWCFFSKRTDYLRPHFLYDEPELINLLIKRFGMTDRVTCRTTMTNDKKRIAGIHIWVLKTAIEEFKTIFDFDCTKDTKELTWLSILNAETPPIVQQYRQATLPLCQPDAHQCDHTSAEKMDICEHLLSSYQQALSDLPVKW